MGRLTSAWKVLRGKAAALTPTEIVANQIARSVTGSRLADRSTQELLQSFKRTPWVHAVVRREAEAVAAVEWVLYRAKGRAAKARAKAASDRRARSEWIKAAAKRGELELVESHPLLDLLAKPNPEIATRQALFEVSTQSLRLTGESFWVIERGKNGKPVELWPMPSHWLVEPGIFGRPHKVQWNSYRRDVPQADAIWIRRLDPENPYGRGVGTAQAVGDEIDTDEAAAKQTRALFANGGLPSAVVSLEGAGDPEVDRISASFERYRGAEASGQIHFTNRPLEIANLAQSNRDLQLIELRKHERDTIIQVFGVPPEVLGIVENSNRATASAARAIFAEQVLVPVLETLRLAIQSRLVPEYEDGDGLVVEYVSPVPSDRDFILDAMGRAPAAFTRNELRELVGYEPVEGGERPLATVYAPPAAPPASEPSDGEDAPEPEEPGDPDDDAEEDALAAELLRVKAERDALAARLKLEPGDDLGMLTLDDLDAILEALKPEAVTYEVEPLWRERVEEWARRELEALGQSPRFDLLNPLITEHLEELSGERIAGINATTRQELRDTLAEGVRAGEAIDDLAKRVEETFDRADSSRAELIARTEVVRSSNWATQEAMVASGVVEKKEWVATPDGRTRDSHKAMNGQVVGIGEEFVSPSGARAQHPGGFDDPAEVCNCFPPETEVASPCGIDAAMRRWYSGKLVEVATEGGKKLTGTPNHPVLTQRGWVALADLNESDYLVHCSAADVAGSSDANENYRPATIQEVFDLAARDGEQVRSRPGAVQDFHGDGRESQVDVVAVNRHLGDRVQPAFLKKLEHQCFASSGLRAEALAAACCKADSGVGLGCSAHSPVRGVCQAESPDLADSAHAQLVCLGPAANCDTCRDQARADSGSGDSECPGNGEFGLPCDVPSDNLGRVDIATKQVATLSAGALVGARVDAEAGEVASKRIATDAEFATNRGDGSALRVKFLRVLNKTSRNYSGHVLNLQTKQGWYIAQNFVSHNCRCTEVAVIDDPKAAPDGVVKATDYDAVWKAFDERASAWEGAAVAAFRRGFQTQRKAALAALKGVA